MVLDSYNLLLLHVDRSIKIFRQRDGWGSTLERNMAGFELKRGEAKGHVTEIEVRDF